MDPRGRRCLASSVRWPPHLKWVVARLMESSRCGRRPRRDRGRQHRTGQTRCPLTKASFSIGLAGRPRSRRSPEASVPASSEPRPTMTGAEWGQEQTRRRHSSASALTLQRAKTRESLFQASSAGLRVLRLEASGQVRCGACASVGAGGGRPRSMSLRHIACDAAVCANVREGPHRAKHGVCVGGQPCLSVGATAA